ncbi:DEAD/DEAH box helicase [Ponticaulis profundi]|uniref:DEAD/DEAH box helicase n=1 Tax=Ponticaulis profundi TaxID=2665222 RepID=A0ABW1SCW7_9PROT
MIEELSKSVWSNSQFHEDFEQLQIRYLNTKLLPSLDAAPLNETAIKRLLQSAIIFSNSTTQKYRDVAYRIATSVSEIYSSELRGAPYALLVVLSRLGNFPALSFAEKRYEVSESSLPVRTQYESAERAERNTAKLSDGNLRLTNFQTELWRSLNDGVSIGISAPTSAGKSFVLQQYVRRKLQLKEANHVALVVPSRALINQVSQDVSDWIESIEGIELITTPVPAEYGLPTRAVYVVTQERLQLLQMAHKKLLFDVLVVDEAQGLGDGSRGVTLSSVVEEAISRNPNLQLLFAGPNLEDPTKLGKIFGVEPRQVKSLEPTVSQNLIFLDTVRGDTKAVSVSALIDGEKTHLGHANADQSLRGYRKKLVNLTMRFGMGGQTIVYAKGTDDCEKLAFQLSQREDDANAAERKELSEFIKDAVHPKYMMATSVLTGVGLHYGRLPSLVRKTIEDAFSEGVLSTLVTTSTLLQGVNLPAQNLFLSEPQRGPNQPLNSIDFWNLAGRAGRLGKEFSGNIFLVDYDEWSSHPIDGDRQMPVVPTIQKHVTETTRELIEYINDKTGYPQRGRDDEFENTFVKLVNDEIKGHLSETLDRLELQNLRTELESAVRNVVINSELDSGTIEASPTVSVHRQNHLYKRLTSDLHLRGASHIIPRHPLDSDAFNSYARAIKRLHDEVLGYPGKDQSHRYFATVILKWIGGHPLPTIIDGKFEYESRDGNPNIATVIRNTLKEIETDLRHKYVRLFSCYNSVLEQVLRDNSLKDQINSIPPLPTFLEVGASTGTMISFMGLGISRYTSSKLNDIVRRSDLTQTEARRWIKDQQIEALDIPSASINELRRMFSV